MECVRDLVLLEGGTTCAAAVATWVLVRARGDVVIGVAALLSRDTRCFQMRSLLADLVGMIVGVIVLCTLRTDGCASMECVTLLLSSVLVAGTYGGTCTLGTGDMLSVCTLGTRCVLGVVEDVATSPRRSGCA